MARSTRRAANELRAFAQRAGLEAEQVSFSQAFRPAHGHPTRPYVWTAILPVEGKYGRELPLGRGLDEAKAGLEKLASNGGWGATMPRIETSLERHEKERAVVREQEKREAAAAQRRAASRRRRRN